MLIGIRGCDFSTYQPTKMLGASVIGGCVIFTEIGGCVIFTYSRAQWRVENSDISNIGGCD